MTVWNVNEVWGSSRQLMWLWNSLVTKCEQGEIIPKVYDNINDVLFLFFTCSLHRHANFTDLKVLQEENTAYTAAGGSSAKCDYTANYTQEVKLKWHDVNYTIQLFFMYVCFMPKCQNSSAPWQLEFMSIPVVQTFSTSKMGQWVSALKEDGHTKTLYCIILICII